MSFYLDDNPDDDRQTSTQICPNCSGTSFYDDPVTGTLTCSSCYTQSQTATQEELDYDDGIGLAATSGGKKTYNKLLGSSRGKVGGRIGRPLSDYDQSKQLPDAESCCLAFQWLLWDASKVVSKLAGIREDHHSSSYNGYYYSDDDEEDETRRPSVMERTVKRIWFAYLRTWTAATREYSAKFPEMRVCFRDYFLENTRKVYLMRHLSVTVGKKIEDEMLAEMQKQLREGEYEESATPGIETNPSSCNNSDEDGSASVSSTPPPRSKRKKTNPNSTPAPPQRGHSHPTKKRKRRTILTISQLCHKEFPTKTVRHPNGIYQMDPHQAVLKLQPSLTLLVSILQLALTHLQTGVAPHHLTTWVANGQLPHALNGYALLPSKLKETCQMVKAFFTRSFVPPAGVVANMADLLATACGWYGDGMPPAKGSTPNSIASGSKVGDVKNNPCHQKSLYNVPLLAARMIQDFGFDERVLNNTMALMGVENDSSWGDTNNQDSDNEIDDESRSRNAPAVDQGREKHPNSNNSLPSPLKCAALDKLHTPLHVAAVIVVACKLCPGWETWKITNLHAGAKIGYNSSDAKLQHPPSSVPWDESQFQLLGTGPTINHYIDFLEQTAFNGIEPSSNVAQFFQSLQRDSNKNCALTSLEEGKKSTKSQIKATVTPNIILSGAPNPNDPPVTDTQDANCGHYTSYRYSMSKDKKILGTEPYHPHYFRLLEYVCYIIEETDTGKLHGMVEEFERELLRFVK